MMPASLGPPPEFRVLGEAYGVAYRLARSGELKELYRTKGWYSFWVFVSKDGQYLVQMGPWNEGKTVSPKDLAVAFHKNGKLLKSYSTTDLVKDPSKVERTVSHYTWRGPPRHGRLAEAMKGAEREALEPRFSSENEFTLTTIDGWTYVFDATTGDIKGTKRAWDEDR